MRFQRTLSLVASSYEAKIFYWLDMSLRPGLLHQGLLLLCCPEFGILLLTAVLAASVSLSPFFFSKKSGLGTTQYHDTPVWTAIFCDSLNAPPSLPTLSPRTLDKDMWHVGY
ncbi:uncharacterized protein ARMOST_22094 [Armillaria ostoyae]|uniref:Uncharacterized protein n=1 Tax=Armillaria ostoyae TaxID=47428 RepID=A0A284SBX0_ARMOS|nr:uncharacterized protein ARMOST_22094 [Armillaria ostoyae]